MTTGFFQKLERLAIQNRRKLRKFSERIRLCPFPILIVCYMYVRRRINPASRANSQQPYLLENLLTRGATVINLDSREDRLREIGLELAKLEIPFHRLPASPNKNGGLGCAMSHFRAIERADSSNEPVFILEDDAEFIQPLSFIRMVIHEFLENEALDVLCLGFKSPCRGLRIGNSLRVSAKLSTTAAYIAKPAAFGPLKMRFHESISDLSNGLPYFANAIDVKWQDAQVQDLVFAIPSKKCVKQRASFSDVELKEVDYGK